MSAHSQPRISFWRLAVYAAALVVLATARRPDKKAEPFLVAPTAVQLRSAADSAVSTSAPPSVGPSVYPSDGRAKPVRVVLATILLAGLAVEARTRRHPWR